MNVTRTDERYRLLFGVRRSVRYHMRRQRWLDGAYGWMLAIGLVLRGAAVGALTLAWDGHWALGLWATGEATTVGLLLWRPELLARLHNDLAREFIALEQKVIDEGAELEESKLRGLQHKRLEIEANEPPIHRVLDAMCHNEQARAEGYGKEERARISWLQGVMAQICDVGVDTLDKGTAEQSR